MTNQKSDIQIKKFQNKAKRIAKRDGYEFLADDFSSWATLKFIEGRKAKISQMLVDFLRLEFGRSSNKKVLSRILNQEYDDLRTIDRSKLNMDLVEFEQFLNSIIDQKDRAIVILYCIWNLTIKEIGYCFGISESRISQIFKKIGKDKKDWINEFKNY